MMGGVVFSSRNCMPRVPGAASVVNSWETWQNREREKKIIINAKENV